MKKEGPLDVRSHAHTPTHACMSIRIHIVCKTERGHAVLMRQRVRRVDRGKVWSSAVVRASHQSTPGGGGREAQKR